jgi:PKD repeat protein
MAKVSRALITSVGLLALAACKVHQAEVPALAGPSGLAVSLRVTATPDSVTLDGGSQSAILVEAIDSTGGPKVGLSVRLDVVVGSTPQDCGTLSARNIVTGSDGKARAVFTAPPMPLPRPTCDGFSPGELVTIVATPSSSNFGTLAPESASIRMVPPGVIVPPPDTPTANFTVSPTRPVAALPALFDASTSCAGPVGSNGCSSPSALTSFVWDFGDGTPSAAGQRVSHTFAVQGSFLVTLTVTNDRGVSASKTTSVSVDAAAAPSAQFTFSPSAPSVNELVLFNATASTAGTGHTLTAYRWNFGDGATAAGANVTHAYTTAGVFSAQLTVTDEAGQSNTVTTPVTVANVALPTASFTFSPAQPAVKETVFFNGAASSAAAGHRITAYNWTFGDGGSGTGAQTTHAFQTGGSFNVTLVVTDDTGHSSSPFTAPVSTLSAPAPSADFSFSPQAPAVGQLVVFDASASKTVQGQRIDEYLWNFGDSTTTQKTTTPQIAHTFTTSGNYNVNLVVTDSAGRTATKSTTVPVGVGAGGCPVPSVQTAVFVFSPSPATVGQPVNFDGSLSTTCGNAVIIRYEWAFGDSQTVVASGPGVTHTYNVPGTYSVTMTITDNFGNQKVTSKAVVVQ